MTRFVFTENYHAALERIEDHIFSSNDGSIELVERFLDEHDKALQFIQQNPDTPAIHPVTGDQSWVFGDGRYRIFFKAVQNRTDLVVYLIHLIDNRESNVEIHPGNKIPTYDEE